MKVSKSAGFTLGLLGLAVAGGVMQMLGLSAAPTVSGDTSPAQRVKVPVLKGRRLAEAESVASQAGLRLTRSGITPGSVCRAGESCLVYAVSPDQGTEVVRGSSVGVRYVTAREQRFYARYRVMPNVVGWDSERVERLFEPVMGLASTRLKEDLGVPVGAYRVIGQSPRPGARLRIGQKITLTIGYHLPSTTSDTDIDMDLRRTRKSWFCRRSKWC